MNIIYIIIVVYVIYYAFNILYDLSASKNKSSSQLSQTIDVKSIASKQAPAVDLSNGTSDVAEQEVENDDAYQESYEEDNGNEDNTDSDAEQDYENSEEAVEATEEKKKN